MNSNQKQLFSLFSMTKLLKNTELSRKNSSNDRILIHAVYGQPNHFIYCHGIKYTMLFGFHVYE